MELMEIIKSSLSIFSAVSFVFIITSYTIYKIKDRTRIKPYLRVNMQSPYNDFIIEEIEQEKTSPVQKMEEIPVPSPIEEEIKFKPQVHERFKIVNVKNTVEQVYVPEPKVEIEKPVRKIKLNSAKLNIYELYSETNEKMHKLKLAVR